MNRRYFETLLREAAHAVGFCVGDVEDGEQLGDLQHFLKLRSQFAETNRCAARTGTVMHGNERAETGAVNHGDVAQIQEDFRAALGKQGLDFFAERTGFFPKHEAPVERDNDHAVHFPIGHFQCHVCFPSAKSAAADGLESTLHAVEPGILSGSSNGAKYIPDFPVAASTCGAVPMYWQSVSL